MDKLPIEYKIYTDHKNLDQMIPSYLDGLLPVQRRILYTAYEIAKSSYVSSARVLGDNFGKYHPFALPEDTIQWGVLNGFLYGIGGFGSELSTEKENQAAVRYTKIKISDLTLDLAFEFINLVDKEILHGTKEEPLYLPTMLPFCFILNYEICKTMGVGYKPRIPSYKINDLIDRLFGLLNNEEKIIKPYNIGCELTNDNKTDDFNLLLKTGKTKLILKSEYEIDEDNECIYLKGWSTRINFEKSVFNRILKYKEDDWDSNLDNNIGYRDISNDLSSLEDEVYKDKKPNIKFSVARKRDKELYFNYMKKAFSEVLKYNHVYHIILAKNKELEINIGVDEVLLGCYERYKNFYTIYLNDSINKTELKTNEMILISKIKEFVGKLDDSVYDKKMSEGNLLILKNSQITEEEFKHIIEKYTISKLYKVNTDITKYKKEIKEYKKQLRNIDNELFNKYQNLRKYNDKFI